MEKYVVNNLAQYTESLYKHFKIIAACHINNYINKMQEKGRKITVVSGKINPGKGMQNT